MNARTLNDANHMTVKRLAIRLREHVYWMLFRHHIQIVEVGLLALSGCWTFKLIGYADMLASNAGFSGLRSVITSDGLMAFSAVVSVPPVIAFLLKLAEFDALAYRWRRFSLTLYVFYGIFVGKGLADSPHSPGLMSAVMFASALLAMWAHWRLRGIEPVT